MKNEFIALIGYEKNTKLYCMERYFISNSRRYSKQNIKDLFNTLSETEKQKGYKVIWIKTLNDYNKGL